VLSDQNIKTFGAALSDAQAVTGELRERKAIIADAQKLIQDLDATTQHADTILASAQNIVDTDGRRGVKNIADAAEEAKAATKDLHSLVDKLQGPTADFANNGLPQITAAIVELQTAAQSLQRLVNEIQRSPSGALGKPASEDVKVKP
jgi:phospholipid/cholesterol/gamma-HCH transport system substrate-binding protein